MSLTSSMYEYKRELRFLDTKANAGEVDRHFVTIFPFNILAKLPRLRKLMEKKSHLPFAKRTFDEGNRNKAYSMMLALDNFNKRYGGNEDSNNAYTLAKQEYYSRTTNKSKNSNKTSVLILLVASLTMMIMIADGSYSWILFILAIGLILSLPTICGLGAVTIFTRWFEKWWYSHCKNQVGIDDTESKIYAMIREFSSE